MKVRIILLISISIVFTARGQMKEIFDLGYIDSGYKPIPLEFPIFNDHIFFAAGGNSAYPIQLWNSDGTKAGTKEFTQINKGGIQSPSPYFLTTLNKKLFFFATTDANGTELWNTDGTAVGTSLLKDINPGTVSGCNISFTKNQSITYKNRVYFAADDGINGLELWVSDGTEAGTTMLADINPGQFGSYPSNFNIFNGKLLFSALDAKHGIELWTTDGTPSGTVLLKDIAAGKRSAGPGRFYVASNKVYFEADDSVHGYEPWVTDGTDAGTKLLSDINPGTTISNPVGFFESVGKVFFYTDNAFGTSHKLMVTNGTTVEEITSIDVSSINYFLKFANYQNKCIMIQGGPAGAKIWESDGTNFGTILIKTINPGSSNNVSSLFNFNNKLHFGISTSIQSGLWSTDGTTQGTVLVKGILKSTETTPFITQDGNLYGTLKDSLSQLQYWYADSTSGNFTIIGKGGFPGSAYIDFNHAIFFESVGAGNKYNLFRISDANYKGTAIETLHTSDLFSVFPNPSSDCFTVNYFEKIDELKILNTFGQVIFESRPEGKESTISIQNNGIYFIQITSNNQTTCKKIIIQH